MTNQLSTIQFYGQSLITIEQDGKYYVALRPICDNIGLAWGAQYNRIKRDDVLNSVVFIMKIPSNGGSQQMLCLPIEYLNGWLFGIDTKRVRLELRDTLIRYKKECYQVLHNYWHKGNYINPQLPWIKDEALEALFSFLFLAHSQAVVLKHLYPALEKMMSRLAPEVYDYCIETSSVFNQSRRCLEDTLTDLAQTRRKWKRTLQEFKELKTLKQSEPQAIQLSLM